MTLLLLTAVGIALVVMVAAAPKPPRSDRRRMPR